MKLRRVCNHGVSKNRATTQKGLNHLTVPKLKRKSSRSPSVEPACDFCSDIMNNYLLVELDNCPLCDQSLLEEDAISQSPAASPQTITPPAGSTVDLDFPETHNDESGFAACVGNFRTQSSKISTVINNIKTSYSDANSKR